jgi:hypothetical protein
MLQKSNLAGDGITVGRPIGLFTAHVRFGGRCCSMILVSGIIVALGAGLRAQAPSRQMKNASKSIEFRSVKDNTPLGLRDTAALVRLLKLSRDLKPAPEGKDDRSDAILQDAVEHPERSRGVPVVVRGLARRVYSSQSPLATSSRLSEIWVTTGGKGPDPVACLVEELPTGFPDRPVVSEPVIMRGLFLKLMAYKVGAKEFVAPLLVGTLEHHPKQDENLIEPPPDDVFVRLPDGLETRSVGPPVEEKMTLKLDRTGRLTIDGEVIAKKGLARKLESLAESIRYNVRAAGILLPADRELPAPLALRAPDETQCVTICKVMLDCQTYGFLKYTLELESGNDPPVGKPANSTDLPRTRNLDNLTEEQRTIQIRIAADVKGRIGVFRLGNQTLEGSDALKRELTGMLNDPNAPFDRANVELDPRLHYSEMVRVARLLSNPAMTQVKFTPADPLGRR